jgi:predicted MPP superfamily phosphohydrolase
MRALVISDLHFEYRSDRGRGFIKSLPLNDVDAVIVAGDLTDSAGLTPAFDLLCNAAPEVIYCLGNHEFWGSSVPKVMFSMEKLVTQYPNLHWLDESAAVICGQRFLGATLWYGDGPASKSYDLKMIEGHAPWVYNKSVTSAKYLRENIRPGDIVVSHHMPTNMRYGEMYGARGWIHGHDHYSTNRMVGTTRVLCNPAGCVGKDENPTFRNVMIRVTAPRAEAA